MIHQYRLCLPESYLSHYLCEVKAAVVCYFRSPHTTSVSSSDAICIIRHEKYKVLVGTQRNPAVCNVYNGASELHISSVHWYFTSHGIWCDFQSSSQAKTYENFQRNLNKFYKNKWNFFQIFNSSTPCLSMCMHACKHMCQSINLDNSFWSWYMPKNRI